MGYSTSGEFTNAERTKLANIEALADVTDNANAVMDADFSGARGFMKKTSAGVYNLITSQELNADIIDFIRQMHPNISVLAAMDDATKYHLIADGSGNYNLDATVILNYDSTDTSTLTVPPVLLASASYTLTDDRPDVILTGEIKIENLSTARIYYRIDGGSWILFGSNGTTSYEEKEVNIGDQTNGTLIEFGYGADGSYRGYVRYCTVKINKTLAGYITSDAIAANAAVLSFFSHLKGKFINGVGNTHATPIQVEIFGNGDSYAAALNATTKFKIDVADSMIELYRTDDSVVAKSGAQTDWVLDDNVTNGAFPTKTTSTHETILAEEIGCASIVLVEKSVNGAFTDTEILIEDDDYTVDYSTRTATKIVLTTAEAADIVISQSKLRITWIADVEDIEGTANTALKMKIYLNRTNTGEASPEIQKIDLGTDKYAEMQYMCG